MRNFMRLATSLVALTLVVAFTSCEKQTAKLDNDTTELVMNITNISNNIKKAGESELPDCSDSEAATVSFTGTDADGNPIGYVDVPILTNLENGTQTVVIKTPAVGKWVIDGFWVKDADGATIWAAPRPGTEYASWVNPERALDLVFIVEAFKKVKVDIDVMCIDETKPGSFGYFWFEFNKISVKNLCFFGDVCTPNHDDWYGGMTQMDFPAHFMVVITDNHSDGEVMASGISNGDGPLCIQFPANPDESQSFNVEVLLYGPWGPDPVPMWSGFLDPNAPVEEFYGEGDVDMIWDFVAYEGDNCNYDGNQGVNYTTPLPGASPSDCYK